MAPWTIQSLLESLPSDIPSSCRPEESVSSKSDGSGSRKVEFLLTNDNARSHSCQSLSPMNSPRRATGQGSQRPWSSSPGNDNPPRQWRRADNRYCRWGESPHKNKHRGVDTIPLLPSSSSLDLDDPATHVASQSPLSPSCRDRKRPL